MGGAIFAATGAQLKHGAPSREEESLVYHFPLLVHRKLRKSLYWRQQACLIHLSPTREFN